MGSLCVSRKTTRRELGMSFELIGWERLLIRDNLCSFSPIFQKFQWKNLTLFMNQTNKKIMKKHEIVDQKWFLSIVSGTYLVLMMEVIIKIEESRLFVRCIEHS